MNENELLQAILKTNQQILAELVKLNTIQDRQVAHVVKTTGQAEQAMGKLLKQLNLKGQ